MDIEQLSKSQIVLLTLLVSFVTSIATGIVTVSLMEQAPPAIAQTVNRVIEHTVEKVVPGQPAAAGSVTQEKTVIVKESDLIAQALNRVNASVVRLYESSGENPSFIAMGLVLDESGTIATDNGVLGEAGDAVAELPSGLRVRTFVRDRADNGIAFFSSATTSIDGKPVQWKPVSIAAEHAVLGQTAIALSGKKVARVAEGIVTTITASETPGRTVIDTDIDAASILPGSPLFNTDGSVVGVSTSIARTSSPQGFAESATLMKSAAPEKAQ